MKIPHLLTAAIFGLFSSAVAIAPASAQNRNIYTDSAPPAAHLAESRRPPELLATLREISVYGDWDFSYTKTPDNNVFVTRVFLNASTENRNTLGYALQIDCGRGMFRHLSAPLFFRNGNRNGSRVEVGINEWLSINRNFADGLAMQRTCEAAAEELGLDWTWYAR